MERGRRRGSGALSISKGTCADEASALHASMWGADALVREPLPSRQRCSVDLKKEPVRTRRPHSTLQCGARTPSSASRCRRGSGALFISKGTCADEASALHASMWGADALVREPLPSRQGCSVDLKKEPVRTRRPHSTLQCGARTPSSASRCPRGNGALFISKGTCADETSAPHLEFREPLPSRQRCSVDFEVTLRALLRLRGSWRARCPFPPATGAAVRARRPASRTRAPRHTR